MIRSVRKTTGRPRLPARGNAAALLLLAAVAAAGAPPAAAQGTKSTTGTLPAAGISTIGLYYQDIVTAGAPAPACTPFNSGVVLFAAYAPPTAPAATTATATYCGSLTTNVWTIAGGGAPGSAYSLTASVIPAPALSGTVETTTKLTVNGVVVDEIGQSGSILGAIRAALGGDLDDFHSTATKSSGMRDSARVDLDGTTVWFMNSAADVAGGGRYFLDSEDRLMLEALGGGAARYALNVSLHDGVTSLDYAGEALLANGAFSATGDFAALPWALDVVGGVVVRAQLGVGAFPATVYDLHVPDGDHAYAYDRAASAYASNVVPEPASVTLVGLGLVSLLTLRRRRASGPAG